jgi:hypothetical protein
MLRFYRAANLPDATLVCDLLVRAGIDSEVFNQHAAGAAGELPLTECGPEVWLMDEAQLPRARAVLAAHERGRAIGPPRICPACGETNPPAFELCWNCGAGLDESA